jgi:hypothetical protein
LFFEKVVKPSIIRLRRRFAVPLPNTQCPVSGYLA